MKEDIENHKTAVLNSLTSEFTVTRNSAVMKELTSRIRKWGRSIHTQLIKDNPYANNKELLENAQFDLKKPIFTLESIEDDLNYFQQLSNQTGTRIDDYWKNEIDKFRSVSDKTIKSNLLTEAENENFRKNKKNLRKDRKITRRLLQKKWQELYDKSYSQWEIEAISQYRNKIIEELTEWLKLLQELEDTLSQLSMEPGLLFDLSKDGLSLFDIEQLKRWVNYISNTPEIKQLCDMLGRLRIAAKSRRYERAKSFSSIVEYYPDTNSKEEITGICFGRDIEYMLPQEVTLLADEETVLLFDLKYVEDRLLCFEMTGLQANVKSIEKDILTEVEEEDKMGPIIICVDTSGSMKGSPETIAKAITLFIAMRSMAQNRNCFLINFSTQIETLDLSKQMGIAETIKFLQRSFHGGTDINPALSHAIDIMHTEAYKRSDLLVISDFVVSDSMPEVLQEKILKAKESKNKFYSLSIGDLFINQRLKEIFNEEWVYNPNSYSIQKIEKMIDAI